MMLDIFGDFGADATTLPRYDATPLPRYNATPLQSKLALERYNATIVYYSVILISYILYLISYTVFIFLVEKFQAFFRAVSPKRSGDKSWT